MLLKNIAHVGSFKHFVFVYLRICVIVYLCILHLIHGNVIYDIFESHAFHLLGLFSTLESEEFEKFDKVAASAAANLHWTRINARAPDGTNKKHNNFSKVWEYWQPGTYTTTDK